MIAPSPVHCFSITFLSRLSCYNLKQLEYSSLALFTRFIHSRDMKTQHIQFKILNKRLSLYFCNLLQFNFVLNMFLNGQVCKENFHSFADVRDDVTRSLDVCHR